MIKILFYYFNKNCKKRHYKISIDIKLYGYRVIILTYYEYILYEYRQDSILDIIVVVVVVMREMKNRTLEQFALKKKNTGRSGEAIQEVFSPNIFKKCHW